MMANNKKGFTVMELVIVIAVIAILAAVLIPTFSGIIKKADESAALQEARGILTNYLVEAAENGETVDGIYIQVGEEGSYRYFKVEDGRLNESSVMIGDITDGSKIISDENNDGKVDIETKASESTT